MCGKVSKSLAHFLAECSSLALTKYMGKHNAALKVLLFEMPRYFKLADSVPPWYSRVEPKWLYESENAQAYWDVPVYAEHAFVRDNRVDAKHKLIFSYLDFRCHFKANAQNHIHFPP